MRAEHDGHGDGGYEKHAGHSLAVFATKFWVCLLLTIPVIAYSDIVNELFGFRAPSFIGSEYIPLAFGSIIFFYGGWVFIVGAFGELKARLPGMMTLISLAITSAFTWSIYASIASRGGTLFWELSTLITIMLLGHWIEMRAVQGTQKALGELAKLLPDTAEVVRGRITAVVPISELKIGDVVMIRPGSRVPADGVVAGGVSEVNESMLTGESRPVKKAVGSEVVAGAINGDGTLTVNVTGIGEKTFLAGVMRLVAEAEVSKSRMQVLSDRAAFYLTVIAIISGGTTFIAWALTPAGLAFAVERFVTVLVIACPHALGLAVPLVATISTALAASNGFLVKQRLALESARDINAVVFDKTGTLTEGVYGVSSILPSGKLGEDELLGLAASVDRPSEHFIARALVAEAEKRKLALPPVSDFQRIPGRGVSGMVGGKKILVGGEAILGEKVLSVPNALIPMITAEAAQGKTVIYVIAGPEVVGAITLGDVIRGESKEAVAHLKALGVRSIMLTGDSEEVAGWVAKKVGMDEYYARVLPQDKANRIKLLQARGMRVAMVGDGINDAPALAQANVGIAIGAGTNVAIESAGIILVRDDPRDIAKIIRLSRLTYRKMIENIFWATGYNVVAIPLAAGVIASQGILLQPAVGAVFMSASTVVVAVNALLLRRAKL